MPYPEKVFLNGEIIESKNATVSVFDRGFLFGDGIYEVLVRINGHFFYGDAHLERLSNSLKKINLSFDTSPLKQQINQLLAASDLLDQDSLIYIQVTRGVAPRKHAFPADIPPTVMMYANPITLPGINANHLKALTINDYRWTKCDIKMTSLLGNVMANDHAAKNNAYEAVFVREGRITEASHCNVFFVKDDEVYTHPADEFILDGITRQITLELCKKNGIKVREEAIPHASVTTMDEAFLTGTTTQIASIKTLDNHVFYQGDDHPPVTAKLQKAFDQLKKESYQLLV
ncbi:MAG: aminotransferase class IV [Balneolaceae bacterium]|nr:aminotransferase class IV [Balneolaceae bacterium]MBO6547233.1 aminotransferase class IV [Balneolaceae bacterium]MBO6647820.1 aminotransferase class IV [Balneolaceae bacterium]